MQVNGFDFQVGADPELFVGKGGKFHNAHGLVKGTKTAPLVVDRGAVQVDGMALEFNIDPAGSYEEFEGNIASVLNQLLDMVPDFKPLATCTVKFDEEFLKKQPKESIILGCEPDYNAYTMGKNPRPNVMAPLRTAGGHVHIGGFDCADVASKEHVGFMSKLTKSLDYHLGIPSLIWDKDDDRRSLYGAAGAFRPKVYGMEYRTLSNMWIFDKKIMKFIYEGVEKSINEFFNPVDRDEELVKRVIDTSDRGLLFRHFREKCEEYRDCVA